LAGKHSLINDGKQYACPNMGISFRTLLGTDQKKTEEKDEK